MKQAARYAGADDAVTLKCNLQACQLQLAGSAELASPEAQQGDRPRSAGRSKQLLE